MKPPKKRAPGGGRKKAFIALAMEHLPVGSSFFAEAKPNQLTSIASKHGTTISTKAQFVFSPSVMEVEKITKVTILKKQDQ